jgi:hypothetical protein
MQKCDLDGGFDQTSISRNTDHIFVIGNGIPGFSGSYDLAAAIHKINQSLDPAVFVQTFAPGFRTVGHYQQISFIKQILVKTGFDGKFRTFFQSGDTRRNSSRL